MHSKNGLTTRQLLTLTSNTKSSGCQFFHTVVTWFKSWISTRADSKPDAFLIIS